MGIEVEKATANKLGRFMIAVGLIAFLSIVIGLLVIDPAILSSGQIGFLTVIMYYAAYLVCMALYWGGSYLSGTWRNVKLSLLFWIACGGLPLFLSMYGYEGPS